MKKPYKLGLDIGGTKINIGLISGSKIIKSQKFPTKAKQGKNAVIKNIISIAREFFNNKVSAIGIGIAGQVDQNKGVIISSPNFPKNFKNINLKKILEKEFKVPVFIDNDANCFILAETKYGAAKGYKHVVGLTLGTGIGGGIIINGKLYRGWQGTAGEFGHTTIGPEEIKCSCGKKGHFEILASGTAMVNIYKKLTGKKSNTFEIEELAKNGDKKALQTIDTMAKYLKIGLANIIKTLNPEIIVIGGGMVRVKPLWSKLKEEPRKGIFYTTLKKTKIVKTKLDDNAGILGATLIIKH